MNALTSLETVAELAAATCKGCKLIRPKSPASKSMASSPMVKGNRRQVTFGSSTSRRCQLSPCMPDQIHEHLFVGIPEPFVLTAASLRTEKGPPLPAKPQARLCQQMGASSLCPSTLGPWSSLNQTNCMAVARPSSEKPCGT